MKYSITKSFDFCYGHRLVNYTGKCARLHGHNATVEVTIESDKLNDIGMVKDFVDVKRLVKLFIDSNLDHFLLLSSKDPLTDVLSQKGETFKVLDDNPTAETIAKHIYYGLKQFLPVITVKLYETPDSWAIYKEN